MLEKTKNKRRRRRKIEETILNFYEGGQNVRPLPFMSNFTMWTRNWRMKINMYINHVIFKLNLAKDSNDDRHEDSIFFIYLLILQKLDIRWRSDGQESAKD